MKSHKALEEMSSCQSERFIKSSCTSITDSLPPCPEETSPFNIPHTANKMENMININRSPCKFRLETQLEKVRPKRH